MRNDAILGLCAAVLAMAACAFGQAAPEAKTAEQVFKNIQTLKGTPADQLIPAMQFISSSLGVECEFCHVQGKMDLDEKKAKTTAREMIVMMNGINKNHFEGHRDVTCYSCHHGASHPAGTPPVLETDSAEEHGKAAAPEAAKLNAAQIVDRYVAAVGGEDAIRAVTSRVATGNILAGGHETPIQVIAKAPNKRISIMKMPNGESITAFDGHAGWLGNTGRPAREMSAAEADAAGIDAHFALALDLKTMFKELRVGRPEKVGGAECQTLVGLRPGQPPVRLYFDEKSGLLVRMVRFGETPLGRNPTQIDYADYRAVDGVEVPLRWTLSRTNGRFTVQIKEVKQNVPVEDSRFAKPNSVSENETSSGFRLPGIQRTRRVRRVYS